MSSHPCVGMRARASSRGRGRLCCFLTHDSDAVQCDAIVAGVPGSTVQPVGMFETVMVSWSVPESPVAAMARFTGVSSYVNLSVAVSVEVGVGASGVMKLACCNSGRPKASAVGPIGPIAFRPAMLAGSTEELKP